MGGGKTTGVGKGVPSGVQGRSPGRVSGGQRPPEAEEFLKFIDNQILRIFLIVLHTFFSLYMPMFFRACRHRSTKSAKWGHLIPFAPLSASGGNCPLCPPAPLPMATTTSLDVGELSTLLKASPGRQ